MQLASKQRPDLIVTGLVGQSESFSRFFLLGRSCIPLLFLQNVPFR
jgi:hypothetical protein